MIDIVLSILNGIIFPLLIFILKKLYYLNHILTELKVDIEWLKKELEDIKDYIFKKT